MNWRTDKPTADVIVAKLNNGNYSILERLSSGKYCIQDKSIGYDILHGENMVFVYEEEIQKWADLEEEEQRNKTMTKEDLDIIVDYINKKSMVDCPYSNDFKVPFVYTKFCDTCIKQKASYKREKYFD